MASVRLRTVDAFTDVPFTGNPAAVVFVDEAPSDEWMAALARETGVDLNQITGTGLAGRVTREDVVKAKGSTGGAMSTGMD